ncbi:Polyadenylate-binding protein, cytoplasmic and nuclear [Wickerhamiella sorbophila]|uniref:Polyadenylate-binding protein n=1 Tax=Wickerhamiella sorbophila TaxID=45607 RepID=A0A2T0FC72_9ASCO|nr:Polyadenylate-binding protein, cytoplasmic and nuclear [Wickerhamiella sorbophila]PRT52539.1 Polyadenylate-binding protein, cytoplasmic and nuclear [Wickerhamiella sorbophila]
MTDASVKSAEKALEQMSLNDQKTDAPATDSAAAATATSTEGASAKTAEASSEGVNANRVSNASLFVGELSSGTSEANLYELFNQIGSVASIRVCRDAVTRESLGYAYVNYHNSEDAQRAMDQLNYQLINGRSCRIMWSQRDPSVRKSGKGNIFIKNLDPTIDNKALHDTFNAFGEILSCKVVTDRQGNSMGYGFIHFTEAEAAEKAIRVVNGMNLNGQEVYVAHHIAKSDRVSEADSQRAKFTNVYVKNLGTETTQEELEALFTPFGTITSAVISTDAEGKSRGFGFVNYSTHDSAEEAVSKLHDTDFKGQKLYVGRAQNKFERQTELKQQHDSARLEKYTKYQGINLYIKNLDDSIDDEKLKEAFAPFGTITSAKVMTDDSGHSRGFGFVCYSAPEEASRAIAEMNQQLLGSKPLYVALAQRKDLRQSQLRHQVSARNQLRLQQQAAVSNGLRGQFLGGPVMYGGPGQHPGFINGPPGGRVPFPEPQMMGMPRGPAPVGQWQAGPGGAPGNFPAAGYPAGPTAGKPESLATVVAAVPEEAKKQVIGEALYPKILQNKSINDAELAGKITGMLLDMDNDELIELVDREDLLQEQVQEALSAYNSYLESQGSK